MTEYNPQRGINTYSLQKLAPAERDELVSSLDQQYPGFQEAANKFLAHTYSNLFEQPIGLVTLAAEYLRIGDDINELFTTQRIFNSLLVQNGLISYQIDFIALSRKNYRMSFLSGTMAMCFDDENKNARMFEGSDLFWPEYTLHDVFGTENAVRQAFVRTFLEPDPHNPRLVRFFFKDFHYFLAAINYVLPHVSEGRFVGRYRDDLDTSYLPAKRRSPNLDPNSIVMLYQMDLLTYIMRREAEAGVKWKL
jgi:hypothetical protein